MNNCYTITHYYYNVIKKIKEIIIMLQSRSYLGFTILGQRGNNQGMFELTSRKYEKITIHCNNLGSLFKFSSSCSIALCSI